MVVNNFIAVSWLGKSSRMSTKLISASGAGRFFEFRRRLVWATVVAPGSASASAPAVVSDVAAATEGSGSESDGRSGAASARGLTPALSLILSCIIDIAASKLGEFFE